MSPEQIDEFAGKVFNYVKDYFPEAELSVGWDNQLDGWRITTDKGGMYYFNNFQEFLDDFNKNEKVIQINRNKKLNKLLS